MSTKVVVGVFSFVDDTLKAIDAIKQSGYTYKVYTPVPDPDIWEATVPAKSPVRFVTGVGALSGLVAGFALAIWTSLDWPMRTSAKTIASIPAFVVVGYEWTILWGAMFTLGAMFFFCRFPTIFRQPGYDGRFSGDKYGVVVDATPDVVESIKEKLHKSGAEEVHVTEAL